MGLLATLINSSNALNIYDQEFATIQNNIGNANTPGYADENLALKADAFDPTANIYGGVSVASLQSTRSAYLEQDVRSQTTLLGAAQQQASDLAPLQSIFNLSSTAGISGALTTFFNSFSALSVTPNDSAARQTVLNSAQALATAFNQAATSLTSVSSNVQQETVNSVASINKIAADLAALNRDYAATGDAGNAGLDAQKNADLESLSQIADFTVVSTGNAQFNVYLGGQTPLVMSGQTFPVSVNFSTPQTAIENSQGNDITSQITGGQLGAQIQERNTILPGYMTALNTLAQTLADTVNDTLSAGVDITGNPPAINLFTYDTASDAADTLAVTPGMTCSQIAAALPSAPGGNGNALALAQLGDTPQANGFTFTQAFGNLGQQVGTDVSNAQSNQSEQQSLVTQAQAQRSAVQGVSLDTEAAKLLQFQQSYDAVAKLVSTLNAVTTALMNMMPPA
ncbi:MAG TPA: flagellar hook-associated protein FlgK [Bryobacteraceae bacterium]|nr:flagellar hook-associated protein FlgK [Bryobacteraceae bacterium]